MKLFKDKKFYIFLGIVILFFGLLIKMNYSVDTYLLLSSPRMGYIQEYLSSGRIFTFLFFFILGFLQVPHYIMYLLSYLIAIFLTTLSVYELNKVLDKYVSNKTLSSILSIAIIINPLIIELWLFIETGIMMLSIFASVMVFKYFDKYLEKYDKSNLKYSFIWMIIGLFSYQGTIALFIALSMISILNKKKDFIKNNFIMLLVYGIPTVINYLFVLLFSRKRVGGSLDLGRNIRVIIESSRQLFDGFGLYFRGFISIILITSIILVIYYIVTDKNKKNNKSNLLLSVLYIIFMIYLFTILPIIPQTGERIAVYPRTCYVFLSMIGILFLYVNKKGNYKILSTLLIILLVGEFFTFTRLEVNRFRVNELDKEIILKIEKKVKDYEKVTNIKVNKLAIYNLDKSHKFYDRLDDRINVSAVKEKPSGIAIYTYYTKRRLSYTDSDKFVEYEYFYNKNYNKFSLDQVVIIDDTIHWYLY